MSNGVWIFPKLGTIFEVVEEKEMPIYGWMYKIRYKDYPSINVKGFQNPDSFEEVKGD